MTVAELIDFLGQFPGECKVMVERMRPEILDLTASYPFVRTERVEAGAVEINDKLEVTVS